MGRHEKIARHGNNTTSRSERHNEVSKLRGHFYGTMVDTPLEFQQMFRYLITPIVLDALRSATYPSRS
jgi:hypothetical protein